MLWDWVSGRERKATWFVPISAGSRWHIPTSREAGIALHGGMRQETLGSLHELFRELEAGNRAAFLCPDSLVAIEGMSYLESQLFSWNLARVCTRKTCWSHVWQKNDLMIVDNWKTLHARESYDVNKVSRLLQRMRLEFN